MPGAIIGMLGGALSGIAQGITKANNQEYNARMGEWQTQKAKELYDYQQAAQYDMWQKTNYPAQVEQLKKAGLNPALLYGSGGGGGTTTGGGGMAMPTIFPAENAKNTVDSVIQGLGLSLMESQVELNKANANKANADAVYTEGSKTDETGANIDLLKQGYDNARQQYELSKLDIAMKNMLNYEQQTSQSNRMSYIETQANQAIQSLHLLSNDVKESDATLKSKIEIVKKQAIQAGLQNILTETGIEKTKIDTQATKTQIQNWIEENMRQWDKMTQENRKIRVQEMLEQYMTDPTNKAVDQVINLFGTLLKTNH